MAEFNGDGTPDAYWDSNLTFRRMNNGDHLGDLQYQRSWNRSGSSTGLSAKDKGKLVGQENSWNYLAVSDFSKSR
jgi:hypothetical protein